MFNFPRRQKEGHPTHPLCQNLFLSYEEREGGGGGELWRVLKL